MATTNTLSTRSLDHVLAFNSLSGPRSTLISSFGRRNVSFSLQPCTTRLRVSCSAKPETVAKVCKIVKNRLSLSDDTDVDAESRFDALGADSLDTVEIVLELEDVFGITIEESTAQRIKTVQEAADLIEDIISTIKP